MKSRRDQEIAKLESELFPTHDDFLGDSSALTYPDDRQTFLYAYHDFLFSKLGRKHTRDEYYGPLYDEFWRTVWSKRK